MVTLLDNKRRPRHPEKAHKDDTPILPKPDWIRVKAPGSAVYGETQKIMRDNKLVTGLPQHRRVLVEEACDLHDYGRHLHQGLRLLQCEDRAS